MKIDCGIAGDLLPLYLEGLCSEDSVAALEEHLGECPACREKLERMKSAALPQGQREDRPLVSDYAKRVRRHRVLIGIAAALAAILGACAIALAVLAVQDMRAAADPVVFEVEEGVCNLSAASLETGAEEVGQYVFYTNNEKIRVTVEKDGSFQGAVTLWDTRYPDSFIRTAHVSEGKDTVTFDGLSSANRYRITCEGLTGAAVTVSDGRTVSFWQSLLNVLRELTDG